MDIVRVSDSDFEMAAAVYRTSWQESHRDVCTPEFLEKRDHAGYLRKKLGHLYMICSEVPVGVFCLDGELFSDLYIHPDHQGKGYGTACISFAKSISPYLRLTVLSNNAKAIRLYEKAGFRFTGWDVPLQHGLSEREMAFQSFNRK